MANRLLYENAVLLPTTTIAVSSEQSSNPASHLKDQQRQKTLRSEVGWTITEDNRRIDVNRTGPGNFTASIALGYYVTGAELAVAILAALEAADATPVWACSYSSSTFKFTISSDLNFTLRWQNGGNVYRSAAIDLGYSTIADDTGTNTYTSDSAVYQSRLFIRFSATSITATAFAFLQHNLPATAAITLQAHTSDDWSAPTTVATYSAITTDPVYSYFASQAKAWWRVVVANTQDPSGFAEVGLVYLGTYVEPVNCIADDLSRQTQAFTTIETGIAGSHFVNVQPERDVWSVGWKTLTTAAQAVLDAFFDATDVGECFFFDFDPATTGSLVYVYRMGLSDQFVPIEYADYATQLVESV